MKEIAKKGRLKITILVSVILVIFIVISLIGCFQEKKVQSSNNIRGFIESTHTALVDSTTLIKAINLS